MLNHNSNQCKWILRNNEVKLVRNPKILIWFKFDFDPNLETIMKCKILQFIDVKNSAATFELKKIKILMQIRILQIQLNLIQFGWIRKIWIQLENEKKLNEFRKRT